MNITGKLFAIDETVNITETFRKREFVIEYAENVEYPELIKFEAIQDKCELLNTFKVGDDMEVSFNLKGRKWTNQEGEDKYFNSLQAWRFAATQPQYHPAQQPAAPQPQQAPIPQHQQAPLAQPQYQQPVPQQQQYQQPAPQQQYQQPAPQQQQYQQQAPQPQPANPIPIPGFDDTMKTDVPF